jgi:cytosine/adenosine deaminase-related metal-dependent hydrolase
MKAIINCSIYDFHDYKEHQYVLFDSTIKQVGSMNDFLDDGYEIIDGLGKLLMPSLVVGHTHLYSKLSRGMSTPLHPSNFKELLEQLWWKLDRNLDHTMTYYSGVVGASDYALNGVTTMIDHHASGEITGSLEYLKNGVDEIGLRGLYCFETSDRFDVDTCIKENIHFINNHASSFSKGLFGLHASFSLSDETLTNVKEVIKDYPIHIHVAESKYDVEDCFRKYGTTIIERLDSFGLLNEDSIIVHGLDLTDTELDIIKQRKCVVSLNVSSNMNNGVGLPTYKRFKEKNIPVIIGNDGISSSITTEYLNLYYTSHLKEESITSFSLDDLLEVIKTTYQYVSKQLCVKLGKIKEGYAADLLLHDFFIPTPVSKENVFGHLFFGYFNSFRPSDVFVDGRQIVKQYALKKDVSKLFLESKVQAENLWQNMKNEVE